MDSKALIVKMALLNWEAQNTRTSKLIAGLSDEALMKEVAPGRNTGIYLLGHLIAVNDALLGTLGIGERKFKQYDEVFLRTPDKSGQQIPALADLRKQWKESSDALRDAYSKLSADEWFFKHTAVSEEDFLKEPHRNRLNVLLSRISHEASHHGQLIFLSAK